MKPLCSNEYMQVAWRRQKLRQSAFFTVLQYIWAEYCDRKPRIFVSYCQHRSFISRHLTSCYRVPFNRRSITQYPSICMEHDDLAIAILVRHGYIFHKFNFTKHALKKFLYSVSISLFSVCAIVVIYIVVVDGHQVHPMMPNKLAFCSYFYNV